MPSATATTNLKRPGDDISEHSNDGSSGTPVVKLQRTDSSLSAHADFSNAIKKKSAGSSRTGQACDRCKIRKIRCDARPGGCSPCLQNNTECKTTDRITGKATTRGHTEHLENENAQLKMYMVELQQQLRDSGVEPKAAPSATAAYFPVGQWGSWGDQSWSGNAQPSNGSGSGSGSGSGGGSGGGGGGGGGSGSGILSSGHTRDRQDSVSQAASLLPNFRAGCIGDNYLGVSSENSWLSPIEGTSLALFGTKIDLAEYMPSEHDPASSAMSYHTFLQHAFNRTQTFAAQLPPYEQCKMYSEWYFRSIQQFIPILHKPDFMDLIERVYHQEHYHPSSAESVMIHMVLAVINFQFSARNNNEQARHDSMAHYHYALSFIPDLVTGHKLEDIQALTLICSQLRNQPRPGAAWMFTNMVMGLAIESGLHRSAKAWQGSAMDQDPHHQEMRKRIFWSLLIFHVHISGKLGRPMPLRQEDFDIEIPEPKSDELPGEPAGSTWKQCSWAAGYEGFKLLRIMMQVYATIYSIKSTGQYEQNVRILEKELDSFYAQIPAELRGGPHTKDEDRVSALYLDISVAECQLLLHHPSLCRSASQQVTSSNLDICLHWSSKMLSSAVALKSLKSLDTTWYYGTDFLAAIFTTLFAKTERRDQMDSADLQRLREDMDEWLDVMGEVGHLLGTGSALQQAIKAIIEFSLSNISRHIAARTASAAVAAQAQSQVSPATSHESTLPAQSVYDQSNGNSNYYPNGTNGDLPAHGQSYVDVQQSHQEQSQTAYPSGNQFAAYTHVAPSGISGFTAYDTAAYSGEESKPNIEAQLAAHSVSMAQPQATNFMAAFQPADPQVTNAYQVPTQAATMSPQGYPQAGPAAWRHFASSMMTNVSGQDYVHSAGPLMALSSSHGEPANPTMEMTAEAAMGNIQMHNGDIGHAWPLIQYGSTRAG